MLRMGSSLWRWRPLTRPISDPGVLLREETGESNHQLAMLIRNLGGSLLGQLEILEQVKPEHLSQRLGRRLLDDLALKMPRDVGEKLTVDAKGFAPRLATALQKLNVKHPVLRARLNNALLQEAASLEDLLERFAGDAADDYTLWLLGRQLEAEPLTFHQLVTCLHRLVPFNPTLAHSLVPRLRQGMGSGSWAKLLQIYDQVPGAPIKAVEVLDALQLSKADVSAWSLPELAVLGQVLERHGLERHQELAIALVKLMADVPEAADAELVQMCLSGALLLYKPPADVAEKVSAALQKLDAQLPLVALQLQLCQQSFELPKSLDVSVFSAPMLLELLNVSATTGVAFTGTAATGHVVPKQLPQLLAKLETEVLRLAPKLSNEDFCRSALALARLGLGAEFLDAGDVEARLGASSLKDPSLAQLVWAMAVHEATDVAWALLPKRSGALDAPHSALLYEGLASGAVLSKVVKEQVADLKDTWEAQKQMPRSEHYAKVLELLPHFGDCEATVQIGDSPWKAPFLFKEKQIILDLVPSTRHPASQKARGDLKLKHNTWVASPYDVFIIPDDAWARREEREEEMGPESLDNSQKATLRWIKGMLEDYHKRRQLKDSGISEKAVVEMLLPLDLGPHGLNSDALKKLSMLTVEKQIMVIKKYKSSLRDYVKTPSAWLIGIINKEAKDPEPSKPSSALAARPEQGWSHQGRALDAVKKGQRLSGKVTNIWKDRVWVDVGLVKDASFLWTGNVKEAYPELQVGQSFKTLKVTNVNKEKQWVEVQVQTPSKQPRTSPNTPIARRPTGGWQHKEGILVAELQLDTEVSGRVTNVLRDQVWVDIGAVKDASFKKAPSKKFQVGDAVKGLIEFIDVKKARVVLQVAPEVSGLQPKS